MTEAMAPAVPHGAAAQAQRTAADQVRAHVAAQGAHALLLVYMRKHQLLQNASFVRRGLAGPHYLCALVGRHKLGACVCRAVLVCAGRCAAANWGCALSQECGTGAPVLQRTESAKSIYQRLGGRPAVLAAVELLYQKMLADPRLAHFFVGVDMAVLMKHQARDLQSAAGCAQGPSPPACSGAAQVVCFGGAHFRTAQQMPLSLLGSRYPDQQGCPEHRLCTRCWTVAFGGSSASPRA